MEKHYSNTYEALEPYFLDFIKGKLPEEMEYRVKAYLQKDEAAQEEVEELRSTLEDLHTLPLAMPDSSLKMEFYAMLNAQKTEEKPQKKALWFGFLSTVYVKWAGFAVLLFAIFFAGFWVSQRIMQEEQNLAVEQTANEEATGFTEDTDNTIVSKKKCIFTGNVYLLCIT